MVVLFLMPQIMIPQQLLMMVLVSIMIVKDLIILITVMLILEMECVMMEFQQNMMNFMNIFLIVNFLIMMREIVRPLMNWSLS